MIQFRTLKQTGLPRARALELPPSLWASSGHSSGASTKSSTPVPAHQNSPFVLRTPIYVQILLPIFLKPNLKQQHFPPIGVASRSPSVKSRLGVSLGLSHRAERELRLGHKHELFPISGGSLAIELGFEPSFSCHQNNFLQQTSTAFCRPL